MEIVFHGHSCVQISSNGKSLIVDPFLSQNPIAKTKTEDIRVQYVLLTHGHSDHIADAAAIAKQNNATVIANAELATYMSWQGVSVVPMNTGGSFQFEFGRVKLTPANHSSSVSFDDQKQILYLGNPNGLLLTIEGKTLYHAGDTDLFSDMKLIGERNQVELAFLPIGDHFTMGPEDAAAAAEWVKAKQVIPVHYNTFPPIQQDAGEFARQLKGAGIEVHVLNPGDSFIL